MGDSDIGLTGRAEAATLTDSFRPCSGQFGSPEAPCNYLFADALGVDESDVFAGSHTLDRLRIRGNTGLFSSTEAFPLTIESEPGCDSGFGP